MHLAGGPWCRVVVMQNLRLTMILNQLLHHRHDFVHFRATLPRVGPTPHEKAPKLVSKDSTMGVMELPAGTLAKPNHPHSRRDRSPLEERLLITE